MSEIDTLMTCAELAIALAGFSGIIVVLSRSEVRSDPLERLRLTGLLATAVGALLLALTPVALSYLQLENDTIWRASSALMAAYVAVGLSALVPRALGDPETRARMPLFLLIWGVWAAVAALQLANATLLPSETRFGIYFVGLAWTLLAGGIFFCLVLLPPRSS